MAPLRALKRRLALVVAAALAVGILLPFAGAVPTPAPTPAAEAADLSQFRAANIIDDSIFYNGAAMTAAEIQRFLDDKIGSCRNGQCLNVLTAGISSRGANWSGRTGNLICSAIEGGVFSIAEIIYRAQVACGISAKVILVTLQKEQGLTTSRAPSSWNLNAAMGAYCPDTAPCDPAYAGIGAQIIAGTVQLKTYRAAAFARQPGANFIGYNPNSACGGTVLNIENYATAALYNYTPYQPNPSALAAGYGTGDGCGAYGNRNFYQYFVDWFGDVRGLEVGSYFRSYYDANKSWLGKPLLPMACGAPNGGCSQRFEGGSIFSSTNSYAAGVPLDYLTAYANYGREFGLLGYPISEKRCDDMAAGVCRQEFQGGWLVVSQTIGYRVVPSDFRQAWSNWGRDFGALGLPTSDRSCAGGMCQQTFQNAVLVKGDTSSTRILMTAVDQLWSAWGRHTGTLGLATSDPSVPGGASYTQTFQGGTVTVTNGSARVSSTADPWFNAIMANTWLGNSTAARSCTLDWGGCYQPFQGGWVVKSGVGSFALAGEVRSLWSAWGRENGVLGFPTGGASANPTTGTYTQPFEYGVVAVTGGVARIASTTDPWFSAVINSPWLGASLATRSCTLGAGGCYQPFAGGWMVRSAAGSFSVPAVVQTTWAAWGREYGILGFPTGGPSADPATGAYTQPFQGGVVTVVGGVARVTSSTDPWFNAVLTNPWLGAATDVQRCDLGYGACRQTFAGGWVMRSDAGVFAVPPAALATWWAWGREYGILGLPSGAPSADPTAGTYTQAFQGGVVTVAGGVGTVTSATDPWFNTVITSGWLGGATSTRSCGLTAGGCLQSFANGAVVRSSAGSFAVPAAVLTTWSAWGREAGILGYPSGAPSADPSTGAYTQAFQGGVVTVAGGVGRVTSSTDPWFNAVLTSPWLGGATGVRTCTLGAGGCFQPFANGWVVRSAAGSFAMPAAVVQMWGWWGREYGALGYPTGVVSADPATGTYTQSFQGGTVSVTAGVASVVR